MEDDNPYRNANRHDRPCDECGCPMIGIMRVSGKGTPRKICHDCGGKTVDVTERLAETK